MHKQTLHIGSFEVDRSESEITQLMRFTADQTLALHVYQLLLAKDEQIFEYATIVEAHHPDYLTQSDLLDIYHYDDSESLSSDSLAELIGLLKSGHGR